LSGLKNWDFQLKPKQNKGIQQSSKKSYDYKQHYNYNINL